LPVLAGGCAGSGFARSGAAPDGGVAGFGDAPAVERVGAPAGLDAGAPELRTEAFTGFPGTPVDPAGAAAFAGVLVWGPAVDPEGFH